MKELVFLLLMVVTSSVWNIYTTKDVLGIKWLVLLLLEAVTSSVWNIYTTKDVLGMKELVFLLLVVVTSSVWNIYTTKDVPGIKPWVKMPFNRFWVMVTVSFELKHVIYWTLRIYTWKFEKRLLNIYALTHENVETLWNMARAQAKRMYRVQWHQRVTIRRRIVAHVVRFVVVRF